MSSVEIAKNISPAYYDNYYAVGKPLTSENALWDCGKFFKDIVGKYVSFEYGVTTFADMGAGTGAIVKLMRDYGAVSVGYEVNEYAIEKREVDLIEADIADEWASDYDTVFCNSFMYLKDEDIERFFSNNARKFKVMFMTYPFNGNNDRFRINQKSKDYFKELAERHGLLAYDYDEGSLIMVQRGE